MYNCPSKMKIKLFWDSISGTFYTHQSLFVTKHRSLKNYPENLVSEQITK